MSKRNVAAAVVTRAEIDHIRERVEDLEDALELNAAAANADKRDYLPAQLVKRMISGESPVRVWREHRGMTAKGLAEASGVSAAYLSQIETGAKPGSVKALAALAKALNVTVDDLV